MSYQAMKRLIGNLNAYYSVKEANLKKVTWFMIPTICHSGKDKTIQ